MRARANLTAGVAGLALAVVGCGSTSHSSGAHPTAGSNLRGPLRIYRMRLAGGSEVPRGAPAGTGAAVIAFHGTGTVCWRFAHLHGFNLAISASLGAGASGARGRKVLALSPGPLMHHQGCVPISSQLISSIERAPQEYYVSIVSQKYPKGAVRGQL